MVLKELILTVSTFGRCGSPERSDFSQFLPLEGVVGMNEIDFNSFYLWKVWCLERTDFNIFYCGRVWWS